METIKEILEKYFSNKELNFAGGQLIIWLVETIFFHFLRQQTSFYYAEERFIVVGRNVCKKSSFQMIKKFFQILILCESKLLKAVLYKSNFVKKVIERGQRYWTLPLMEFRFETKLGCFVTRYIALAHRYLSTHFLNLQ